MTFYSKFDISCQTYLDVYLDIILDEMQSKITRNLTLSMNYISIKDIKRKLGVQTNSSTNTPTFVTRDFLRLTKTQEMLDTLCMSTEDAVVVIANVSYLAQPLVAYYTAFVRRKIGK